MPISLQKDFILNTPKRSVHVEKVGEVVMQDISLDESNKLREFYYKVMRPNYILGESRLFNWMFKNNGGRVAVLTQNEKVIAHQGHVPIVFTDGESDHRGFISATTVVDEDYRRRGLMTLLRGSVQDRYEMACSIGGSDQGVALYKAMHYKLFGSFYRMVAIINPEKCVGIAKEPAKLKRTHVLNKGESKNVKEIKDFFGIESEIKKLINKIFIPKTFFGVKRDSEFFDWRYSQHPYFDYKCHGLWDEDTLKALIVYRVEEIPEAGSSVIRITELIGERDGIAELVNNTVLTEEVSKEIGWIDFFCANKKISKSLNVAGFLDHQELQTTLPIFCNPVDYSKTKYPVMLWSKDESIYETLPPLDNWYLTKGDGDADRPNQLIKLS